MHSSTSVTAIVATAVMLVASVTGHVTSTGDINSKATYDKSKYLSELASKLSTQIANPTFQAELAKITESKPSDLLPEITSVIAEQFWGNPEGISDVPAWMTALPTTGYAYKAIHEDFEAILAGQPEDETPVSGTVKSDAKGLISDIESNLGAQASSVTASIASALTVSLGAKESSVIAAALTDFLSSKASSVTASLGAQASSLQSSLASKASSVTSSIGSRISSAVSTATSVGGAQAQATAMGAVLGGFVGFVVLL